VLLTCSKVIFNGCSQQNYATWYSILYFDTEGIQLVQDMFLTSSFVFAMMNPMTAHTLDSQKRSMFSSCLTRPEKII
jgi:hypothetical protein